jgi:4-hydroxy-2-oxoglutarate aldolase
MTREIGGLLPPIPTPFDADENLALDPFRSNIEQWNRQGYSGYVVLGSNGEFVHLTEQERWQALETARLAIPPDKLMVAGANFQSTREACEFARRVAALRADAVLMGMPHYYRESLTAERLIAHYWKIADASPIPIILYNVPQFTGLSLTAETVARLAEHPNIAGIKDSSGNFGLLAEIVRIVPPRFSVLTGAAAIFYPALAVGARGAILAVSVVAPQACHEIMMAVATGNHARAAERQLRLLPVARAVTTQFGIAGLKAALDLLGYYGGPPRSPLAPASESVRVQIRDILRASGLIESLA